MVCLYFRTLKWSVNIIQNFFIKTYDEHVEILTILIHASYIKVGIIVKDILCLLFFKNERYVEKQIASLIFYG